MGSWFAANSWRYPHDWKLISLRVRKAAGWKCEACDAKSARRQILTVDHLDHDPRNCDASNLMALCQRCHLRRQGLYPRPQTREEALRRLRSRHEDELSQGDLFK